MRRGITEGHARISCAGYHSSQAESTNRGEDGNYTTACSALEGAIDTLKCVNKLSAGSWKGNAIQVPSWPSAGEGEKEARAERKVGTDVAATPGTSTAVRSTAARTLSRVVFARCWRAAWQRGRGEGGEGEGERMMGSRMQGHLFESQPH